MTRHPWAGQKWGSRAGQLLCAVVAIVLALGSAGPARSAPHPTHPAARRNVPARLVRDDAPRRSARSDRKVSKIRQSTSQTTRKQPGKHAAPKESPRSSRTRARVTEKPSPRSRGRHSRREPEPDNDPPLLHRVGARRSTRRGAASQPVSSHTTTTRSRVWTSRNGSADDKDDVPAPRVTRATNREIPLPREDASKNLPQASDNLAAEIKEFPSTVPGTARERRTFLPDDHAARQAVIEQAVQPVVLPAMYNKRGRLIVPAPLKGSREILVHQNTMADTEGLDRIADDDALEHMQQLHLLVPLHDASGLLVNDGLPENRRYARPWTARFVLDMGRAYYARFHDQLHLSSAVRTVEYQLRLQRVNGNAAAVDGDGASPHLTGQAVDFGKRGMSMAEIAWMRAYLGILMRAGKIDVEEEFQQSCFHISVYKSYLPAARKTNMEVAEKKPLAPQP